MALLGCLVCATVPLSACGGGSSSAPGTTSSTGGAPASTAAAGDTGAAPSGARVIVARHGGFRTVLPSGFRRKGSRGGDVELRVTLHSDGGRPTNLTVYRAAAHTSDLHAITTGALRRLAQRPASLPKAQGLSPLQSLQVDGHPALSVDYKVVGPIPSEWRQVFVLDHGFVYEISDSAAPTRFAASLIALEELIQNWRWQ
jgi:hypothetical protein